MNEIDILFPLLEFLYDVNDGSEIYAEVGVSAKEKWRTLVTFALGDVVVESGVATVRGNGP
ncbi:hypothetical protein PIB30_089885, partial [Stylosanthes scabra]|nr:hypothetical protein [Stylosanthes scabra]